MPRLFTEKCMHFPLTAHQPRPITNPFSFCCVSHLRPTSAPKNATRGFRKHQMNSRKQEGGPLGVPYHLSLKGCNSNITAQPKSRTAAQSKKPTRVFVIFLHDVSLGGIGVKPRSHQSHVKHLRRGQPSRWKAHYAMMLMMRNVYGLYCFAQ